MTISALAAYLEATATKMGEPPKWAAAAVLDGLGLSDTSCRARVAPPWGRRPRAAWCRRAIKAVVAKWDAKQARRAAQEGGCDSQVTVGPLSHWGGVTAWVEGVT